MDVWAGNWITETNRTLVGRWDLGKEAAASPNVFGEEQSGNVNDQTGLRFLSFQFSKREQCRILWVKLTLQNSSRVSVDSRLDLLSLAPSSKRNESSGATWAPPCIHARRIIVVGSSLQDKSDLMQNNSVLKQNWRNFLEQPVSYGRLKVIKKCFPQFNSKL